MIQPSISLDVTIPPGGTVNYQPSGGSVALIESDTDQDVCEGATLGLTFTSS